MHRTRPSLPLHRMSVPKAAILFPNSKKLSHCVKKLFHCVKKTSLCVMNTPSEYFTLYPCAGRTRTWPPSSTSSALCPTPRTGQNRRQRHPTTPSSPKPHSMLYLCIVKGLTPRPSPKGRGPRPAGPPSFRRGWGRLLR